MSKGKLGIWMKDNVVLIVGIPLIIGIHWGWSKLQEVPYLVDQSTRKKEIPLVAALKALTEKAMTKISGITEGEPSPTIGRD